MKINIKESSPVESTARQFALSILANRLFKIDSVDTLLAKAQYENKIQIYEHQTKTALSVLNNFAHRALLADEVGLGKTIEAGIILKELVVRKIASKILILTPATLKFQWQEEMRSKFGMEFTIADDTKAYTDMLVIASIDTAKTQRHKEALNEVYWDMLIIDEAHKLKNSQTQNYKLVKQLNFERCLMLTATPLQNNIFELWALLDLLHPGFLGTKNKFKKLFIVDKDGLQIKNREALHAKLNQIMIRNLRKDTNIKFVKRNVKTHLLKYSPEESKFYNDVLAFIKKEYEKVKEMDKSVVDTTDLNEDELRKQAEEYRKKGLLTFGLIMLTRQISSSIKTGIKALENYSEGLEDKTEMNLLIEQGKKITSDKKLEKLLHLIKNKKDKIIIFTTFINTQEMLAMELGLNGFDTVKFNGKMTPQEKEDAIEEFRNEKQVLVCTDAGSEGRNLQFAHIMVNYDLPWNPMRIEQRIGRVHRLGQTKDVIIHNLSVADTIETYILNRLYEKIDLFQVAIGEMDLILSQMNKSFERSIFDAAMDDEDISLELLSAKEEAQKIKRFDNDIFS